MKSSDDLFLLVHSLSKNEKGYFKKYASRHVKGEQNNYIRLFDFIDRQKNYDEKKLKLHFKGETFVRHLPSEKNYLYQLLLRSLGEFHSASSSEKTLHDLLHHMSLLYDKALYPQCYKLLKRAKKIAGHYEKPLILLQLHEWESRLLIALAKTKELEQFRGESKLQQHRWLDQYEEMAEFRYLEESMHFYSKTYGFPRNKKERARYQRIMSHPLMKNGKKASTYRATFYYYNIHNFYYELLGKPKETYRYRKMLVDFAEQQPHLVLDDQQRYMIALNNLLNSQDELGLREDCEKTIAKLKALPAKSANMRARIFGYTWNIALTQYILSGEFEKVVANAREIEDGLKVHVKSLHPEFHLAFKYQFFCGYFGAGKFSQALKWMNHLLNDDTVKIRPEIYFFARIMNLVLHFELGNTELLAYNMRNTYRLFIRQKRLYRFETIMLGFIRRSGKYNTPAAMREAFTGLKKQLTDLLKDPYESQVLSFFDIISWLESKITKRSFAQIVREKAKK